MPEINFDVGFDVECDRCGATLKAKLNRAQDTLSVEPCEDCMVDEYHRGEDDTNAKRED